MPNPPNPRPVSSSPNKSMMKNFQHFVELVPADPTRQMNITVDSTGYKQARMMIPTEILL